MKTQPQKLAHTKGEWKTSPGALPAKTKITCNDEQIADCFVGKVRLMEAEANAQRIVKAVNMISFIEKRIEAIKMSQDTTFESLKELAYLEQLLKQAEQK